MQTATFGTCFSNMFLDRISNPDTFAPLDEMSAYQDAQAAYDSAHSAIFDQGAAADHKSVQALIDALYRLQDMQMQYIYRVGIQDGMQVCRPDFCTVGIA